MAKDRSVAPLPEPEQPAIHEATRATDGSDAVDRGAALSRKQAIARRKSGGDIVVCGPDTMQNDQLAGEIEVTATSAGGKCIYHGPHGGPLSLPHWQQKDPPPEGHSFHETNKRQARIAP
jgi:hypothetical protein